MAVSVLYLGSAESNTHVVEDNKGLRPATIVVANGVKDTTASEGRDELLNEQDQENARDSRQIKVVDQEERLELERFAVTHDLAATKDDGIVDDNEDGSRLEGRHRRLERHELELLSRVSDDGLPGLAEYRP